MPHSDDGPRSTVLNPRALHCSNTFAARRFIGRSGRNVILSPQYIAWAMSGVVLFIIAAATSSSPNVIVMNREPVTGAVSITSFSVIFTG